MTHEEAVVEKHKEFLELRYQVWLRSWRGRWWLFRRGDARWRQRKPVFKLRFK